MKAFTLASAIAAVFAGASLLSSVSAASLDPVYAHGKHFFYSTNGSEFYIKGVAYQQDVNSNGSTTGSSTFTDPLADPAGCARDIPLLQGLGTNTIRVYAINASLDHSQCMQMLANAGIYVLQDLSNPSDSINRDSPEWTIDLFASYTAVIDAMAGYTNVLGFFAGNEVSNAPNNTAASAFVKAAVRDCKAYIKAKGYRPIGVGYATNDDASIRVNLADYFNCGDPSAAIDFWGYNIYSWCGASSYTISGYDQRTAEFANYSVPAFFAEYGCNTVEPRLFTEVQALYGTNMTPVWSGGVVYMYFQEANNYGLVSVSGSSVTKLPDYTALSSQLALISPSSTPLSLYTNTFTNPQACPTAASDWAASSNLPPIANPQLCSCMVSSLTCVPKAGLSSNDTQNMFGFICGADTGACGGISANGTTGVYGAYSMCEDAQKLAWVVNQYYLDQKKASSACDFSGNAHTVSPTTASTCSALLSQAGAGGTGSVTNIPTAAGSGTSGGSGGSGSSGGSASGSTASATSSKAAAGSVIIPRFDMGMVQLGVYVVAAMMTGAGMILL